MVRQLNASGGYVAKKYTILTAGSVSGTFGSVVNTDLPSGFKSTLSYDGTHAYLDLALLFVAPPTTGLSGNQSGVGNKLIDYFNRNGGIPLVFGGLTPGGLTQLAGETAVGSQQSTFTAMTQFMNVITDFSIHGRGDGGPAPGSARPAPICDMPSARPTSRRRWPMAGKTSPPIEPSPSPAIGCAPTSTPTPIRAVLRAVTALSCPG